MRPTHSIESILGTRSRVRVLRVLSGVTVPLNATQVAMRTGLTKMAAGNALAELSAMGLVQSSPVGRATVHMLVRENAYVERIVSPVFEAERTMADLVEDELRKAFSGKTESIVLFGSYARGEQDETSDVDVVLVANEGAADALARAADECESRFRRRFGATLSALVYSQLEARELPQRAPALFESIARDAIVVAGIGPREWVNLGAST
jgi:predicted nucleotidyltransferase